MAEEISLSLEETNKLRVSIGLAPIPSDVEKKSTENGKIPAQVQEISLQETNKLRASIGLAPIPEKDVIVNDGENNFAKHQVQEETKARDESLKRRLEQTRESNDRKKLARVKLVYDEPINSDDWLSNLGKPKVTKSKIRKVDVGEDKSVKIGHKLNQLTNLKQDSILTLEDTSILDDLDDELQNEELKNQEKLKFELLDKKKADMIKFNGRSYRNDEEEEEVDEMEISTVVTGAIQLPHEKEKPKLTNKMEYKDIFAETDELETSNDYSKPKKIKKLKKKSKSTSSRKLPDADEEVVTLTSQPLKQFDTIDEDDELQNVLSLKRRLKQKQERKNLTQEELAAEITLYKRWDLTNDIESEAYTTKIFDNTSEFVNSIEIKEDVEDNKDNANNENNENNENNGDNENNEDNQHNSDNENNEDNQHNSDNAPALQGIPNIANQLPKDSIEPPKPTFSSLALTLAYLQDQNIIDKSTTQDQESERVRQQAAKKAELLKLNIEVEERILRSQLKEDKQFMNKPKVDREVLFEQLLDERLKLKNIIIPSQRNHWSKNKSKSNPLESYNPKVNLAYRDDEGNALNTKQAFKYLSHEFHGNGSGNKKKEKQIEKVKSSTAPQGTRLV